MGKVLDMRKYLSDKNGHSDFPEIFYGSFTYEKFLTNRLLFCRGQLAAIDDHVRKNGIHSWEDYNVIAEAHKDLEMIEAASKNYLRFGLGIDYHIEEVPFTVA